MGYYYIMDMQFCQHQIAKLQRFLLLTFVRETVIIKTLTRRASYSSEITRRIRWQAETPASYPVFLRRCRSSIVRHRRDSCFIVELYLEERYGSYKRQAQ